MKRLSRWMSASLGLFALVAGCSPMTEVSMPDLAEVVERDGVPFDGMSVPEEVLGRLSQYRVVVVGETHHIREQQELMASFVRALYARGFRQLLLEWPHYADWVVTDFVEDRGRLVKGFEAVGSFDYFFPGGDFGVDVAYWEVNANLVYRINTRGRAVTPYVGTGLNVARFKASTHVLGVDVSGDEGRNGLNLLGGFILTSGRARPFIEGRFVAGDGGQVVASAGVRF